MRSARNVTALLSTFAGVLAVMSTVIAAYQAVRVGVTGRELRDRVALTEQLSVTVDRSGILVKLQKLEERASQLEAKLQAFSAAPKGSALGEALMSTRAELSRLSERLGAMETAVLNDPGKALAVPILRKDIDNVKESAKDALAAVREEVARIYDLSKWFLGLMITIALAVLGLAIQNFLPRRAA